MPERSGIALPWFGLCAQFSAQSEMLDDIGATEQAGALCIPENEHLIDIMLRDEREGSLQVVLQIHTVERLARHDVADLFDSPLILGRLFDIGNRHDSHGAIVMADRYSAVVTSPKHLLDQFPDRRIRIDGIGAGLHQFTDFYPAQVFAKCHFTAAGSGGIGEKPPNECDPQSSQEIASQNLKEAKDDERPSEKLPHY